MRRLLFLLIFTLSCNFVFAQAPTNGLVAYYPFNGNANDAAGTNHGTVNGATLTTDRFGNLNSAYNFDGGDVINTQNPSGFIGNVARTFSVWINITQHTPNDLITIIKGGTNGTGNDFTFLTKAISSNQIQLYLRRYYEDVPSNFVNYSLNKWVHVIMVYDGTTTRGIKFYLNGINIGQTNQYGDVTFNTVDTNWSFGNYVDQSNYNHFFVGKLDDIRIYNRALSDTEVQALYQAEAPPIDITTGLVAHYKMDGNAQDASGNSNHGTAQNGVTFGTDRFGNAGKAAGFDGVDDYIIAQGSGSLNSPNQNITLSSWINVNQWYNGINAPMIDKANSTTTHYTSGLYKTGNNYFDFTSVQIPTIQLNNWYQKVVVQTNNKVRVYLNGIFIGESNNLLGGGSNNLPLYLGSDPGGLTEYLNGKLDDIRIYNRALSDAEVLALYNSENSGVSLTTAMRLGGGQTILNVGKSYKLTTTIKNNNNSTWVGDVYYRVKGETPTLISSNNIISTGSTININANFSPQTFQIGQNVTIELLTKQGTNDFVGVTTVNGTVNPILINIEAASNYNYSPNISLSQAVVSQNQTVEVFGNGFRLNQKVGVLTYPSIPIADSTFKSVNSNGSVSFSIQIPLDFTENNLKIWLYQNNDPAVGKILKVNMLPKKHLKISYPTLENQAFFIKPNGSVDITIKDFFEDTGIHPKDGNLKRKFRYLIGYKTSANVFMPITEIPENSGYIGYGFEKVFNLPLTDAYFGEVNTVKNIKFVVKDFYDTNNSFETPFVAINISTNSICKIKQEWDKSGNSAVIYHPIGVAADGVARMYLTVEKENLQFIPSIQNVNVDLLSDEGNNGKWIGRVKYATIQNNNSYSLEANDIQTISASSGQVVNNKAWFWYVSPDDFNNDINFSLFNQKSERVVTAKFTITFSDQSTEVIEHKIKIFRPHIMLVHGIGGNHQYSWEKVGLINDPAFNKSIFPVSLLSSGSVDDNAKILIGAVDRSIYRSQLDNTIQGNLQKIRDFGIACNQMDVITHSTGANAIRLMYDKYQNDFYNSLTYKSYGKGFINKMIAINPAFDGTPMADMISAGLNFLPYITTGIISGSLRSFEALDKGVDPFSDSGFLLPSMIKAKGIASLTETEAMSDLRSFAEDRKSNYFFDKLFNIPSHIIGSDMFGGLNGNNESLANSFIASDKYNSMINILYQIADTFEQTIIPHLPEGKLKQFMEIYLEYRSLVLEISETETEYSKYTDAIGKVKKLLDCLKVLGAVSKNNDFPVDSDLLVPISSMLSKANAYDSNVTISTSNQFNFQNFHTLAKDTEFVKNKIKELLNKPAESIFFKPLLPLTAKKLESPSVALSTLETTKKDLLKNQSIFSSNPRPTVFLRDTTLLKIINPIRLSSYKIDDEFLAKIFISNTDSLKDLEVNFIAQHTNFTQFGNINNFKIKVNEFAREKELIIAQGVFYTDSSINVVTDTVSIFISNIDFQLNDFNVIPQSFKIPLGSYEYPKFEIVNNDNIYYNPENKNINSFSSNTNVAYFNNSTGKIIAINKGEAELSFTYKGITKTVFVIVGEGGVPYSQTITTSNLANSTVCSGQTIQIPFTTAGGSFSVGNQFFVQLSDKNGDNFKTLTTTGTVSPLSIKIPNDLEASTGYKIRVISTNVPVIGTPSNTTLTINNFGTPPTIIANKATFWLGESVTLSASACPSGQSILWSSGQTTSAISISPTQSENYTAVCKNTTCETKSSNSIFISKNYCPTDFVKNTNSTTGSNVYKASHSIEATHKISGSGTSEILEAPNTILKPGFETQLGVIFRVQVGGCSN